MINLEAAVKRTPGNEKRKCASITTGSTVLGCNNVSTKNSREILGVEDTNDYFIAPQVAICENFHRKGAGQLCTGLQPTETSETSTA
jgi:hypothetical protein